MPDDSRPLDGRTAVVTGASRGIGLAIARALAGAGARLILLARGEQMLAAHARALGLDAAFVAVDLADRAAVERAIARVRELVGGAPDILVNNAGAFPLAPVDATDPATFVRTLDLNLVAPFLLAHAFLPLMRDRGRGDLVTIGSIADRVSFPENGAYAASKFGARALHEVMRAELRGSGVRAILVSPGPVDTPLWDELRPEQREGFTPRAKMLRPEAVADAVLWAVTRPPEVDVDELRLSRS